MSIGYKIFDQDNKEIFDLMARDDADAMEFVQRVLNSEPMAFLETDDERPVAIWYGDTKEWEECRCSSEFTPQMDVHGSVGGTTRLCATISKSPGRL